MTAPQSRRPAPRTVSKKPDVSVVDQLAEDAVPDEYPPGVPEFRVPLALKRPQRAEFKRRFAEVIDRYEAVAKYRKLVESKKEPPVAEQMRISAELDEVAAAVDGVLRLVAVDEDAYETWSAKVGDDDLMKTFNVYQKRAQPGEASSSTN